MPSFPGKVSKEVDRVRDAFRRGAQARQSDFDIKRVQDLIAQEHRNDSPNLINLAYLYDVLRGVVTSSGFKKYGDITIPDVVFDAFDANQDTDVPVEINFVWNIAVLHARGFVAVSDASLGIMVKSQIQIVIRAAASQFNLYNVVNALAVLRMCLQDDIGADDRVAILSVVNKVIENFVPGNAIYYRFGSPKLIEFLYALRFFIDKEVVFYNKGYLDFLVHIHCLQKAPDGSRIGQEWLMRKVVIQLYHMVFRDTCPVLIDIVRDGNVQALAFVLAHDSRVLRECSL